jgi:hypothetical protein
VRCGLGLMGECSKSNALELPLSAENGREAMVEQKSYI